MNAYNRVWAGAALLLCGLAEATGNAMEWIYSTDAEQWVQAQTVDATAPSGTADITVFPKQQLQVFNGFGGAFNELGWEALMAVAPEQREAVMQALFSPDGLNFSMGRIPIGASDYALSYYSLNDTPEDFSMRNFNIDRDRYILIPYVKEALKIRPDLTLWASPWTPPAWMKVNNHYSVKFGGPKDGDTTNEMDPRKNILNNATAFRMEEAYLQAYALYFSKFVQAYGKEGVTIASIQPQNEIAYAPYWPACTWRCEDMAYFIGKHLGPRFEQDGIDAQIWLGTINWSRPEYVRTILQDEDAAKYIQGVGFQWGGRNAIETIHKEFPDMQLMQTESECGDGENNWQSVEHTWKLMREYFTRGANSYVSWNMVLDQTGASSWGWPQNSLVVINTETGDVRYTAEFHLYKQVSHYLQPGAHLLETSEGNDHLAFVNPDGKIIVLVMNQKDADREIAIGIGNQQYRIKAKAKSINTLLVQQ